MSERLELPPGWIAEQIHDSRIELALYHPATHKERFLGSPYTAAEIIEIRRRYRARFKEWTGEDL